MNVNIKTIGKTLSARQLKKRREELSLEFCRMSSPVLSEAVKLVDVVEPVALANNEKVDKFLQEYPYSAIAGDISRMPGYRVLGALLRFLATYAGDPEPYKVGVNLSTYAGGVPSRLRRLADRSAIRWPVEVSFNQERPSEEEYHQARESWDAVLDNCLSDLKPLYKPIEHYSEVVTATCAKVRAHRAELERSEDTKGLHQFWINHAEGLSSLIMSNILNAPGGRNALLRAGRDMGFWLRLGKPLVPKDPIYSQRYIQVRVGFTEKLIPVEQLADFIAGK